MSLNTRLKILAPIPAVFAGIAIILFVAGCGSNGRESAEKMTSFASVNAAGQAELFTVPQDQMSHIQIVTIRPRPLTRTLRLSGQVAYNGFKTTPVISPVGGPVSRVLVFRDKRCMQGSRSSKLQARISHCSAPAT